MRRSKFRRPKVVLSFNGAQNLIAVTRALNSAAELTKGNLQSIYACCTGKHKTSGGLYFSQLNDTVEIEIADLGTLLLADYDELCGEVRVYYTGREMAKKRVRKEIKEKKEKNKKK